MLPFILMSFSVGLVVGLTSMGGAALMAPFLILVVGVKPVSAVGTDLVYGAVAKIVGACVHYRQGTVDLPVVKRLASGSLPGGIAGAVLVTMLPRATSGAEHLVRRTIGASLVVVAILLFVRMVFRPSPAAISERSRRFLRERCTIIWGALVGFVVGFTSVGSGSLLVPFLLLLYPARTAAVVGTDVFHAAILMTAAGLVHAKANTVEWNLLPYLLAGSIPGVLIGSRLAAHVPPRLLRAGLAALLLLTGVRMCMEFA
jgi:uncharacterized membrane protein YfcA